MKYTNYYKMSKEIYKDYCKNNLLNNNLNKNFHYMIYFMKAKVDVSVKPCLSFSISITYIISSMNWFRIIKII